MLETQCAQHYKMRMKVFNSDQQRVMYLLLIRIAEMTCEKKLDSHYRGSHYSLYILLSHFSHSQLFLSFFRIFSISNSPSSRELLERGTPLSWQERKSN